VIVGMRAEGVDEADEALTDLREAVGLRTVLVP
jgi:hypothetical protein